MMDTKYLSEKMELKPYFCYHCSGLIGMTSHDRLFIGASRFTRSITMECGYCAKHTYWRPNNENYIKDNKQ